MTAPRELETARLLLRSLAPEDVTSITRLAGAKEIAATTLRIPHPYRDEDARAFLAIAEEDYAAGRSISFAVVLRSSGEFCGAIGLQKAEAHNHAELGYWIGVPYWGRGYATEAARAVMAFGFQDLLLNRIFAQAFAGNVSSQRVLEKLGMRHEGRLLQHVRKWDQFIDIENYALLSDEFRQAKSL
jgi:[ribosomal protein S5]-alanine N-acetyltransferase